MKSIKTRTTYVLCGSDFSQQEPRLMSNYSKDSNMIEAYKEGKVLYSMIASKVFKNKYEDNLEFYPDGTKNEDGAKRRKKMKGLLLGIMYGMGVQSIANTIEGTYEEAQGILDGFYESFPQVKTWIDKTEEFGMKYGYAEDWYGRRRRLSNLMLDPYEVTREDKKEKNKKTSNVNVNFNPFLGCGERKENDKEVLYFKNELNKVSKDNSLDSKTKYRIISKLTKEAKAKGITITSNTSLIASAKRKCVNARIQGGASTMTKIAMNKLFNDKELNDLDFHMMIGVHDELIGECPKVNVDKVANRLTYIMQTCIEDYCVTPFKCDAEISTSWYYPNYCSAIRKELRDMIEGNVKKNIPPIPKDIALEKMLDEHIELPRDQVRDILLNK